MSEQASSTTSVGTSPRKSLFALTSLVLGILGFACLFILPIIPHNLSVAPIFDYAFVVPLAIAFIGFPLACVFGILALDQIRRSGGRITGRGQAISGVTIGTVGVLLQVAMILPAIASAREEARLVQCMNNLKQIGLAINLYADAHDGNIPRAFDDLRPYATNLDKLLICPSAKDRSHPSYQIMLGGGKWQGDNP